MSTVRELLELAAKAAGYVEFTWGEVAGPRARKPNGVAGPWNPLTDDGDAMRLAVKLGFQVLTNDDDRWGANRDVATVMPTGGYEKRLAEEPYGGDPYAANRLAIVRAAAEIGKAMPLD